MTSGRSNPFSGIVMASNTQSPESYLYTHAIKQNLGEQAALVVSSILSHGALTVQQLHHHTTLPAVKIKQALVSLLQMNIVVHSISDWKKQKAPKAYHFHEDGALKLLYAGEIISCLQQIYPDNALMVTIIQTVLCSGHLTLQDFLSSSDEEEEINKCFNLLVEGKWLVPIDPLHFQNRYDILMQIFRDQSRLYTIEKGASKTISQSKKLAEIKEMTRAKYASVILEKSGLTKDLRVNGMINPDVPLTFNLNRFLQRQRDVQLVSFCRQRFGEVTSRIYSLILDRIERDSKDIINDELELTKFMASIASSAPGAAVTAGLDPADLESLGEQLELADAKKSATFNASDILRFLKLVGDSERFDLRTDDLLGSIVDPSVSGTKRGLDGDLERAPKRVKLEQLDDVLMVGTDSMSVDPDQKLRGLINEHLRLLVMDTSVPFLHGTTEGWYYVPFTKLTTVLKDWTYRQYIKTIFGNDALRLLSCISEKRLIEEKLLASTVLMKENAVRSLLQKMATFQLVEIQEIPKTQDRSAMRSTFAFRHRPEAASSLILKSLTYSLADCLDRIEKLKDENRILLDKTTREDVMGKEEEMLITSELVQLQNIFETEVRYLVRFGRLRSGFECLGLF